MDEQFTEITTDILISKAISASEKNEDDYWDYIRSLHIRGSKEVLQAANKLCNSSSIKERITGSDILAQLGVPDRSFPKEVLNILHNLVREQNQDSQVLNSALVAIGHTQDADNSFGLSQVIKLSTHPNEEVRLGVVMALWGHEDTDSVKTMVALTRDIDSNVRDWATTGIGSIIETDTDEIRIALWERVETEDKEECNDTYWEALMGLATRKDPRIHQEILTNLLLEDPPSLIFEAASELGEQQFLEPMENLLKKAQSEEYISESWVNRLKESIRNIKEKQKHNKKRK